MYIFNSSTDIWRKPNYKYKEHFVWILLSTTKNVLVPCCNNLCLISKWSAGKQSDRISFRDVNFIYVSLKLRLPTKTIECKPYIVSWFSYKVKKILIWPGVSQWKIYYRRKLGKLSTTCNNLTKRLNGELLVAVHHNQLRTMASETVDPSDWLHTPTLMSSTPWAPSA